jgi:hypothetical protein
MKLTQLEELASYKLIRDLKALIPQVTTKRSVKLIEQRMELIRRERYVAKCRAAEWRRGQSEWQTEHTWASEGRAVIDYRK